MADRELQIKQWVLENSTPVLPKVTRQEIHQLNLVEIPSRNSSFRVSRFGNPDGVSCEVKVLLVVGPTGAGKTTLINSLVNYVFGVERADDFRFQLIPHDPTSNQSQSQTTRVSCYTLYHQEGYQVPYTLTIIDTPGFGDTAGIARDEETFKQIHEFCQADIVDHIDGVGFVVNSTDSRLSPTQKYLFGSIMSLFGNDIAKNIFLMLTFSDCKDAAIMPLIRASGVPFQASFKFNNSAVFEEDMDFESEDTEDVTFTEIFWKLGTKSFEKFTKAISKIQGTGLGLTKEVLQIRQRNDLSSGYVRGFLEKSKALHQELKQKKNDLKQLEKQLQIQLQAVSENVDASEDIRQSNFSVGFYLRDRKFLSIIIGCLSYRFYWLGVWFLSASGLGVTVGWLSPYCGRTCVAVLIGCLSYRFSWVGHWIYINSRIPRLLMYFRGLFRDKLPKRAPPTRQTDAYAQRTREQESLEKDILDTQDAITELEKKIRDKEQGMRKELQYMQTNIQRLNNIALIPSRKSVRDYIDVMISQVDSQSNPARELEVQILKNMRSEF